MLRVLQAYLTMADNTIEYRAQVAVEDGQLVLPNGRNVDEQNEPDKLTARKCLEFSVKRPENYRQVYVTGVLALSDTVIVNDLKNHGLKLFDHSGRFLSSINSRHDVWGITSVNGNMFATSGVANLHTNKSFRLWTVCWDSIVSEDTSHTSYSPHSGGIYFNSTYFGVLHGLDKAISVLDTHGKLVKKFRVEEAFGKKVYLGFDIHMDSATHNIYVPCGYNNPGVLCVSIDGSTLWFTPLADRLWGIIEVHGLLCVADLIGQCLHLLSKAGEVKGKLLDKTDIREKPCHLSYNKSSQKIFLSYADTDTISVYQVTVWNILTILK